MPIPNPFSALKNKFEDGEKKIIHYVQVWVLREDARVALSRLATLDPDRASDYTSAIACIGDD